MKRASASFRNPNLNEMIPTYVITPNAGEVMEHKYSQILVKSIH